MKNQNFKTGFTLIEALVAISILMIAIASPLSLAQKGLSISELSRDQMIASFLAQDGMEAVKNIRDQVALGSGGNWLSGLGLCIFPNTDFSNITIPNNYCNIDTTKSNLLDGVKNDIGVEYLKIHTDDGTPAGLFKTYDLSSNLPSKFLRYISIATTTLPGEALVRVRVSWNSQMGLQNVDVRDFIYNYSNNPNVTN